MANLLAYLAGGAAEGLGAGMAAQAKFEMEEDATARRDKALAAAQAEQAKLSSNLRREENTQQGDITNRNNAAQVDRTLNADLRRGAVNQQYAVEGAAAAAAADKEQRQEERQYETRILQMKQAFERDEGAKERQARLVLELGRPISEGYDYDRGEKVLTFSDGKGGQYNRRIKMGAEPERPASSGDSLLDYGGGGGDDKPTGADATSFVEEFGGKKYRYTPGPGGRANQDNWSLVR